MVRCNCPEEKEQKRRNKKMKINQDLMDRIAIYMDEEKREQAHREIAPCSPEEFLKRYLELDPDFENILKSEFSIEL